MNLLKKRRTHRARFSLENKLKLVMTLTSGAVLLVTALLLVSLEAYRSRRELVQRLATSAELVGRNTTAALAFDDHKAAGDTLASLAAIGDITAADLFDSDGRSSAAGFRRAAASDGDERLRQPILLQPKNGSRPRALNREVVIIVQHEQRRSCRSGSPAG